MLSLPASHICLRAPAKHLPPAQCCLITALSLITASACTNADPRAAVCRKSAPFTCMHWSRSSGFTWMPPLCPGSCSSLVQAGADGLCPGSQLARSLSRTSTKFLPVWFAYVISEAEGVIGERFFLFFTSPRLFLSLSPTCHHKTSFFALFCCRSSTLYIIFRRWKKMQLFSKRAIEVASERKTWMTAFGVTANNIVV